MAVNPLSYDASGVAITHTETGHTGTIPWAEVVVSTDGLALALACPACASVSCHPVSGGSAPEAVQELFVEVDRRAAGGRTRAQALARVRRLVATQDGPQRWQLG